VIAARAGACFGLPGATLAQQKANEAVAAPLRRPPRQRRSCHLRPRPPCQL